MRPCEHNAYILRTLDQRTVRDILAHIAAHYGCGVDEIKDEVLHEEAENLLEYITDPMRSAVMVVMQRRGMQMLAK